MKLRRIVTTSALLVGVLATGSGVADAEPVAEPGTEIGYESHIEDRTVVTTLDAGAFALASDGKSVAIKDAGGATVVSLPLAYRFDGLQFPFEEEITEDGKTLRLTPSVDKAEATPISPEDRITPIALHDVASIDENTRAQSAFQQQLGIAMTVGSLGGTIVGGILGFAVGCVVGTPVAVFGCLPFGVTGAGIGALLGTIVVGGPTLAIAGIDLINTLNAPPGTTKWVK
ncbi:ammonium transporter [Rhodococcus sp. WB9]|uniref:ammonium transporter n=1 Tax=Rhodococcus sp. WB9 TaxID=2594007 RepID=UPI0011863AA1|nr:ammonium transporter [Rhodococcus sp. WB9]QDQ91033.1 ammonium transporter [Rhodococcus sp. WB9]